MLTICETMLVGVGENDAVSFLKTAHTKKGVGDYRQAIQRVKLTEVLMM